MKDSNLERLNDENPSAMNAAEALVRNSQASNLDVPDYAAPAYTPDAILLVDEMGNIAAVDSGFEVTFGYHRSAAIGNMFQMLLSESIDHHDIGFQEDNGDNRSVYETAKGMILLARHKCGSEFRILAKSSRLVIPYGIYTIVLICKLRT